MPKRANDPASLEFVSRQIGRLIARDNMDFDSALGRIAAEAAEVLQPSIASLRDVVTGDRGIAAKRSTAAMAGLLQVIRGAGGRVEAGVVGFLANATVGYDATVDVVRALRGSVAYALALLAVLCIVGGVLEAFVVPSFATLYGSLGTGLPRLTRLLLAHSWPLALVALLGLSLGAGIAYFSWQLGRAARQLLPLPRVLRALPLAGRVARSLDALIYLTYTSTLLAGGVLAETARARAASLLDPDQPRQPGPPLGDYLDLAQRLGVLPEEVQSQLRAQARDLAEATDRFGRTVDLALRLAIYLAIAVFVIAMYLPIFTIGSTV